MKLLVTGACGFVGSALIRFWIEQGTLAPEQIMGLDNLSRAGSEQNLSLLRRLGVRFLHRDIRQWADVADVPAIDWVIDAAANPSVLAGTQDDAYDAMRLTGHNLLGTLNLLELCKTRKAGMILLSSSRVYSIPMLTSLPIEINADGDYDLRQADPVSLPPGISSAGIAEHASTAAPVSLYGATKLAGETLAKEYSQAFGFPLWIDRCGVLTGAGQLARADQGIFSFWIHSWYEKRPLRYIGFDGQGRQVRDCLHVADLATLLAQQMNTPEVRQDCCWNVGGGRSQALSLRGLSAWCRKQIGPGEVASTQEQRLYDLPWAIMDNSKVMQDWNWQPRYSLDMILQDILNHAHQHPQWLSATL